MPVFTSLVSAKEITLSLRRGTSGVTLIAYSVSYLELSCVKISPVIPGKKVELQLTLTCAPIIQLLSRMKFLIGIALPVVTCTPISPILMGDMEV